MASAAPGAPAPSGARAPAALALPSGSISSHDAAGLRSRSRTPSPLPRARFPSVARNSGGGHLPLETVPPSPPPSPAPFPPPGLAGRGIACPRRSRARRSHACVTVPHQLTIACRLSARRHRPSPSCCRIASVRCRRYVSAAIARAGEVQGRSGEDVHNKSTD